MCHVALTASPRPLSSPSQDNQWNACAFGNGTQGPLFVAVASSGSGNRVMTSPDGQTWTLRASAADLSWTSVAYGLSLFVAVAGTYPGNSIQVSPDGINWTLLDSPYDQYYFSVAFGGGVFVAVGLSPLAGYQVAWSDDGLTWSTVAAAADLSWRGVAYGQNVFAAVASSGTGNRAMTSSF